MLKYFYREENMVNEKNIILVGLSNEFVKFGANLLAEKLGYYNLDVDSMLEYTLMDRIKMKQVCGVKYLDEQEKKVIKSLNDYEKTVMSIKLDTFAANVKSLQDNNMLVYLSFNKKQVKDLNKLLTNEFKTEITLNDLLFQEHDKYLKKNCDIILKCDINNIDESFNELIERIK